MYVSTKKIFGPIYSGSIKQNESDQHAFFLLGNTAGWSVLFSKPPVVMAGLWPAMTTAVGRRPIAGWLFKKTAIWRCEIVMESDRVSYLKVQEDIRY